MSKEVQRWADSAMFRAEPIDAEKGPQVYLLGMTADPLGHIAAACKMYKGEVVRSLADVTHEERKEYLQQVQKTKLKAPFEFVKFHFLFEGVSRAFTHQMVRQRTAAYAQESLRFAVKEDMPQYLPPSLQGTYPTYEWISHVEQTGALPDNAQKMRFIWDAHNNNTQGTYNKLIDMGMPAEDARGRLPHDTLTRIQYTTDLRALQDHAGNRLCTQAQFEWRLVWAKIIQAIREYSPYAGMAEHARKIGAANRPIAFLERLGRAEQWQYEELSKLFRPVCYLTGKCEFKANFDRPCKIRERVDANEKIGRPSSEWDEGSHKAVNGRITIQPIKPYEWLADSEAAR
jgi:thymidylate synthase (FAD)